MTKHHGTTDRIIRTLLGFGLIAYGIVNHHWIGAIGLVPLLTAIVGFCPAYCPLGLSTRGKGDRSGGGGGCSGGKCGG